MWDLWKDSLTVNHIMSLKSWLQMTCQLYQRGVKCVNSCCATKLVPLLWLKHGSSLQSLFQSLIFRATQSYVGTVRPIIMVAFACTSMLKFDTNDRTLFRAAPTRGVPRSRGVMGSATPWTPAAGFFLPDSSCRLSSTLVCSWGRVYARTLVPVAATCRVTLPWLRSYCGSRLQSFWHEANRKAFPPQANSENSNQTGRNVRPCPH